MSSKCYTVSVQEQLTRGRELNFRSRKDLNFTVEGKYPTDALQSARAAFAQKHPGFTVLSCNMRADKIAACHLVIEAPSVPAAPLARSAR